MIDARNRKGTTHTEKVACQQQGEDDEATIVDPDDAGDVCGGGGRTAESIVEGQRGDGEQEQLQHQAAPTPAQEAPKKGRPEQIDTWLRSVQYMSRFSHNDVLYSVASSMPFMAPVTVTSNWRVIVCPSGNRASTITIQSPAMVHSKGTL